jgi:hypothetical protein
MEERKTQGISPEEKHPASLALRKISRANYRIKNREAINAYMNNLMKERYKNDEVYRAKEIERGKLRYRKVVEQKRLDVLAKESQQSLALTENRED